MAGTGFWWVLLAAGAYGVLHSVLASDGWKRLSTRLIGESAYRRFYRLFFSTQAVLLLLPVLALAALMPDRVIYAIPRPWLFLTLLIQAVAAIGVIGGVLQTGALDFLGLRQAAGGREFASDRLITSGLYRYVRHPLYSFSYLFLWLLPVMTWNLLALVIALSIYLWIGSIFEERKLAAHFGPTYEEYRRRTPRFLPRLLRR